MGFEDLNQKYTIAKYCTRNEVAKSLGTNLIEPIWKQISDYRKLYARSLPIYDAVRQPFLLTYIESTQEKAGLVNEKISKYIVGYGQLGLHSLARVTLTQDMLKSSLKQIARLNKIDVSEITLQNLVEHKNVDNTYLLLKRYLKCLETLASDYASEINEEFLANYYAILRGQEDNLTSFYRDIDTRTTSSFALVDREYDAGVPTKLIDEMMSNLLEYISNPEISIISRLVSIFFMFNYIKPFEEYNDELSCLLAKRVFASTEMDGSAIYIPCENLLTNFLFKDEIFKEVQRSHDFTYAFIKGAELLDESLTTILDRIVQLNVHALDIATSFSGTKEQIEKEFGKETAEKVAKVLDNDVPQPKVEPVQIIEPVSSEHTEKEFKEMAENMLESDPFIKKGQAHFYVRHCTKGKFYTIQQYKKAEGCVYETARTSMDNLATRGYYRREQIKNKFVYTPIDKE